MLVLLALLLCLVLGVASRWLVLVALIGAAAERAKCSACIEWHIGLLPPARRGFRRAFPFSLIAALALFSAALWRHPPRASVEPDSVTYVFNAPTRAPLYPWFLRLTTPEASRRPLDTSGESYRGVVLSQRLLACLALVPLLLVLYRFHALFPLYLLAATWLARVTHTVSAMEWIEHYVDSILTEALMVPWLFGLAAILIVVLWREPRKRFATFEGIGLGLWLYAGIELSPRLLAFAPLAAAPLIMEWSRRPVEREWFRSGIAPLFLVAAVLSTCAFNQYRYDAFSPTPFQGIAAMDVALVVARPGDERLFSDPETRELVRRCLADPELRHSGNAIDVNTWTVARRHYTALYSYRPDYRDSIQVNRLFARISRRLLFNPGGLRRWLQWTGEQLTLTWEIERRALGLLFLTLLISAIGWWYYPSPGFLFSALAPLVHLLNIALTVTLYGPNSRYLGTTLILLAPATLGIAEAVRSLLRTARRSTRAQLASALTGFNFQSQS